MTGPAGRSLPPGDDGSPDPELAAALAAHAAAPSPGTRGRAQAALAAARVYAPGVMQRRTGASDTAATAMALLTLRAADGSSGLAVFSSLERLTAFRPDARPLPVRGADVLATAVAEGHASVVLDLQGPATLVVDGADLRELAAGYRPVAGAEQSLSARMAPGRPELRAPEKVPSPGLSRGIVSVLSAEPGDVVAAYVLDGRTEDADWERVIALVLADGADPSALGGLAGRLVAALRPHLGAEGIGLMALGAADGQAAAGLASPVWQRG